MSRRQSVPSNIFYRRADPMPPLFPEPWEGDIYFNTTTKKLRIFYVERDDSGNIIVDEWRDCSFDVGRGETDEVWVGPYPPTDPNVEIWVKQRWQYNDVYVADYDLAATFDPSIMVIDPERGAWHKVV